MQQTQMHEMTINPIKNTQSLQVSLLYSNQTNKHVEILTWDFFKQTKHPVQQGGQQSQILYVILPSYI